MSHPAFRLLDTSRYYNVILNWKFRTFNAYPFLKNVAIMASKKSKGKGHQIDEARDGDIVDHTLFSLSKQKKKRRRFGIVLIDNDIPFVVMSSVLHSNLGSENTKRKLLQG